MLSAAITAACSIPARTTPPPSPAASPDAGKSTVRIAITVDDLPQHGPLIEGVSRADLAARLLEAFARHNAHSVHGFVNGKRVDDDPALEGVLRQWIAAGHPLGNHTYAHPSLNKTELRDFLGDLDRGEQILARLSQDTSSWHFFRYPFLFEGDSEEKRQGVRAHLQARGYQIAQVSIDADDWAFSPPYARCYQQGNQASLAALHDEFVAVHVEELQRMRALSRELVGREIAHVLLLHVGVIRELVGREIAHVLLLHVGVMDAEAIDALLNAYEQEGAQWIGLQEALADPFYQADSGPPARYGSAFPYRVARARNLKVPPPIFARGLEERLESLCRP